MATGRAGAKSGTKVKLAALAPVIQIKSVFFTIGTPSPIVSGSITIVKS